MKIPGGYEIGERTNFKVKLSFHDEISGKDKPVEIKGRLTSIESCQIAYMAFRDALELGMSDLGEGMIIDEMKQVVAKISYNGRAWEALPFRVGMEPFAEAPDAAAREGLHLLVTSVNQQGEVANLGEAQVQIAYAVPKKGTTHERDVWDIAFPMNVEAGAHEICERLWESRLPCTFDFADLRLFGVTSPESLRDDLAHAMATQNLAPIWDELRQAVDEVIEDVNSLTNGPV